MDRWNEATKRLAETRFSIGNIEPEKWRCLFKSFVKADVLQGRAYTHIAHTAVQVRGEVRHQIFHNAFGWQRRSRSGHGDCASHQPWCFFERAQDPGETSTCRLSKSKNFILSLNIVVRWFQTECQVFLSREIFHTLSPPNASILSRTQLNASRIS